MVLRHSLIWLDEASQNSPHGTANLVCYKCPRCDSIQRFDVQDEPEYLGKVVEFRKGRLLFVPDMEDWERDEEIKKQLSALGYF
jgi:hypothetical protein